MVTRIYLSSSGAAAISPAFDSAWEDTSIGARLAGVVGTPSSTTMTTVSFTDASIANRDILFKQYIVGVLAAQTIGVQTVEYQIRGKEGSTLNNMLTAIGIRAVASDATTFRGTLLAVTRDGSELSSSSLMKRRITASTSSVTVSDGDYLVIEIGTAGTPNPGGSHGSDLRIGDNGGSDLPEDDTDTNDYNPWVEFANDLTFNAVGGGQPSRTMHQQRLRRAA